jgi:transcription initiation factor TFIIIB Brf1 subunit/transcription initiation factor TFIIB
MHTKKSSKEISLDEFDEIYDETLSELADRESLPAEIHATAAELIDDMPPEVKQHYHPRHMAAATLHIATRQYGTPRTAKQFARHLETLDDKDHWAAVGSSHVTKTRRCVRKLKALHDLDLEPPRPEHYMPLLGDRLNISDQVLEQGRALITRIRNEYLVSGRSPIAVAASATYLASKHCCSETEVDPGRLAETVCRDKKTIRDNAAFFRQELGFDGSECS